MLYNSSMKNKPTLPAGLQPKETQVVVVVFRKGGMGNKGRGGEAVWESVSGLGGERHFQAQFKLLQRERGICFLGADSCFPKKETGMNGVRHEGNTVHDQSMILKMEWE